MPDVLCYDSYGNSLAHLTQWDSNIVITIKDYEYETTPIFHFSNRYSEKAIVEIGELTESGEARAKVPNELLIQPEIIKAYVFTTKEGVPYKTQSLTVGQCVYKVEIPVHPRVEPDDFEYVENIEKLELSVVEAHIATLVEEAEARVTRSANTAETNISNMVTAANEAVLTKLAELEQAYAVWGEIEGIDGLVTDLSGVIGSSASTILAGTVTDLYDAEATSVKQMAFYRDESLKSVELPECVTVGDSAFYLCRNLTRLSLPKCTRLGQSALYRTGITELSLPSLSSVGSYVFQDSPIVRANFPALTVIPQGLFAGTKSLVDYNFANVTSIGSEAFRNCSALTELIAPNCTALGDGALSGCTAIEKIVIAVTSARNGEFDDLTALKSIELTAVTELDGAEFYNNPNLEEIILRQRVAYISGDTPFDIPSTCMIKVNQADLSWYAADSFWSTYYNNGRLVGI